MTAPLHDDALVAALAELDRLSRPEAEYLPDGIRLDRFVAAGTAVVRTLAAHQAPAPADAGVGVPEGWVMVPVEPTKAMLSAIAMADWKGDRDLDWADGYRIMLAAFDIADRLKVVTTLKDRPETGHEG